MTLFIDADSSTLRHGAIETSPANVVFVADPASDEARQQGWIMRDLNGAREPALGLELNSQISTAEKKLDRDDG